MKLLKYFSFLFVLISFIKTIILIDKYIITLDPSLQMHVFNENLSIGKNKILLLTWDSLVHKMAQDKINTELKAKKYPAKAREIKVVVDISEQTAYVYNPKEKMFQYFRISTGGPSIQRRMEPALWKIITKQNSGLSPIYGPRLMMLAKYNGYTYVPTTIALHGTNTPEIIGKPLSLGCVYFRNKDILTIYPWLALDDKVITVW